MFILIPKIISMIGLSCYLTIAVINNLVDRGTNRSLLAQMLSMDLLKDDPAFGKGLLNRAIKSQKVSVVVLNITVVVQILISLMLWYSSIKLLQSFLFQPTLLASAINSCNIALSCFMVLWFFFWCGGLWFGYWMKTGQIQEVHMRLIIISIVELIFLNYPLHGA